MVRNLNIILIIGLSLFNSPLHTKELYHNQESLNSSIEELAEEMKDLNSKFRNKNVSTDVLSFPLKIKLKNKLYLGDIAISFEIINKRAKSTSFDHELDKMWIHGYLHLLGHDHKKNKDYYLMNKRENLIFKKLNKIN